MPYKSPLQDTKFILENLLSPHKDLDTSTIDAVLSEAGKLADNDLAPLNHFGDKNNPVLRQDNEVQTPEGFKTVFSKLQKVAGLVLLVKVNMMEWIFLEE